MQRNMPRLIDIEDIKNSLQNSVEINFCGGATFPFIEITFSLSEKETAKIYDFISEHLKERPKMQIYFVFKSFRKFARPFNISSYVALGMFVWYGVSVPAILS